MKRLLMISYPFPPNSSAGAVRSERFARYLPQFGWVVDVVTIKPRHDLFEDSARLANLGKNVKVHFTSTLDPWLWLKIKRPTDFFLRVARSILMRLFSFPDHMLLWILFAVKTGLTISKHTSVDAIYTTSPPHSSHLAGLVLSRLLRKPWVADFRDPWTLSGYRKKDGVDDLLLKIERVMETAALKKASIILANTKANRLNLLKAFPWLISNKVTHLPNGWEEFPEMDYPAKQNEPLTIVHAGTFYPRFKPYALLYALAAWRGGKYPPDIPPLEKNIQVILLGSKEAETKRVVQDLGIEDILQIKPWVDLEDARKIMCQADMLWASLGTEMRSSTYIPSKLFEYIAAKRPILGFFAEGEAASLIRETGTGIVFTNDDQDLIIRTIHKVMSLKRNKTPAWFRPNKQVIASYHIEKITYRLSLVLNNLFK